jgi:hypothetical protein
MMGAAPRIKFYLMHLETGQRYPVHGEVVIGRTSGDIVFPADPSVSQRHCRIVEREDGLILHDLGSANGTTLNGQTLAELKAYPFPPEAVLTVGHQSFQLKSASFAKKVSRRRSKRRDGPDYLGAVVAVLLGVGVAVAGTRLVNLRAGRHQAPPLIVQSPYEIVEKEVRATFNRYEKMGRDRQYGLLSDKQTATSIRRDLLPDLRAAQVKLEVVIPQGEFERRKLEVQRRLVAALIGQVTAMAEYSELKTKSAADRLSHFSQELEKLSAQARALDRIPAQVTR